MLRNRSKLPTERQSAAGLCTVECLCRQESRGFALDEKSKVEMENLFSLDPKKIFEITDE